MTISIYETVAANLGDLIAKGTVASASPTHIDSTALIHEYDNILKGYELFIASGGGEGQSRTITSFVAASNRAGVSQPFTTTPSTNSTFLVFQAFKVEDYENSVNRALKGADLVYLEDAVATLELVGTQYEYPVPSGLQYISKLRLVPSGNTEYDADDKVNTVFEFPGYSWRLEQGVSGSKLIIFDPREVDMTDFNEKMVRVVGQWKADLSVATLPNLLEEYVIAQASMILAARRISEEPKWQSKYLAFREMARLLYPHTHSVKRGKKV